MRDFHSERRAIARWEERRAVAYRARAGSIKQRRLELRSPCAEIASHFPKDRIRRNHGN